MKEKRPPNFLPGVINLPSFRDALTWMLFLKVKVMILSVTAARI